MATPFDIESLIETWRGPLVGLVAGWGAPWAEARELAQDTLVEAYLCRERLEGNPGDPAVTGPWLRGIARNLHNARRRRSWRRRETELPPAVSANAPTSEEDERLETLREAMGRLPEKLRCVLFMHYLEGTPVREVAALLGVPETTVTGRLHQARARLRDLLRPRSGEGVR